VSDGFRVRHAVRVLLLDEQDRLLLFRSARRGWWQPPGGGIEEGEDVRVAATRELAEETGLLDLELGPEIWHRSTAYTWHGIEIDQRERWLMARTTHFEPDTAGLSARETADLAEWRWWTVPELILTNQHLVPSDLGMRIFNLLEQGPPGGPIRVGQ
jgi:8-oxo-dGTP pyrophosphatase MutT (NUDIX family)